MFNAYKRLGVCGILTDGPSRDLEEIPAPGPHKLVAIWISRRILSNVYV